MLKGKNILIISNEPWGDMWYSKHNYAYELSKNNNVIFVNPPIRWSIIKMFASVSKLRISRNLEVINYFNVLPAKNRLLFQINNFIISKTIKRFLKKNNFSEFIFWSFDPYRLYSPLKLGASKSVFHAVDNYLFTHWGEKKICENVDYIICVSDKILKNYLPFNKKNLVVPHALSEDEFVFEQRPIDAPSENYALYVGNIDKRLDYYQLEFIIKNYIDIIFVFIGRFSFDESNTSAKLIFIDKKYPNVVYLGVKKFKELKNYINYSKFCFAFMDDHFPGNRIAHHKIYQYLAFGKPVFCSPFSDYLKIKNYLYMEDETMKIVEKINFFLTKGEDSQLERERIKIALENTFEKALKKIEKFIYE